MKAERDAPKLLAVPLRKISTAEVELVGPSSCLPCPLSALSLLSSHTQHKQHTHKQAWRPSYLLVPPSVSALPKQPPTRRV